MVEPIHIPVMLNEVIEQLNLKKEAVVVDGTLRAGGHALEIIRRIGPQGKLVGIDCDAEIISKAKERLNPYLNQCEIVHSNYSQIDQILSSLNIAEVDGILLDLGVSSYQLDTPHRGFSVKKDGPLDMRMDQTSGRTAAELIHDSSEEELSTIFYEYGEERHARSIARAIVRERTKKEIQTTPTRKHQPPVWNQRP